MGQKINSNIIRIGEKNNSWKSKFIEKKFKESYIYIFKDQEIKKYIKKFLKNHGLALHEYKLNYLDSSLDLFISYYNITDNSIIKNKKQNFVTNTINNKFQTNYMKKDEKIKKKVTKFLISSKKEHNKKIKFKSESIQQISKEKRIKILKLYKKYPNLYKYKNTQNLKIYNFIEKFFENLSLFTNQKININLTLQKINKNLDFYFDKEHTKILKEKLIKLRKFNNAPFYKNGVNILFTASTQNKPSNLLSEFIASHLKTVKRHKFFLVFLEQTLKLFLNSKHSKIKGIKIIIKGRFNGAPRAKKIIISIGTIPLFTINSEIDYSDSISFTPNGTFGIKVWTCKKKYVFTTKKNKISKNKKRKTCKIRI